MKIEMYEDSAREWRWRMRTPNGRIIADSAEGYSTKPGVRRSIANLARYLLDVVEVVEVKVKYKVATEVRAKVRVSRPKAAQRKAA